MGSPSQKNQRCGPLALKGSFCVDMIRAARRIHLLSGTKYLFPCAISSTIRQPGPSNQEEMGHCPKVLGRREGPGTHPIKVFPTSPVRTPHIPPLHEDRRCKQVGDLWMLGRPWNGARGVGLLFRWIPKYWLWYINHTP